MRIIRSSVISLACRPVFRLSPPYRDPCLYARSDAIGWRNKNPSTLVVYHPSPKPAGAHGIYSWYLGAQDDGLRQILFRVGIGSQERTERVPSVFLLCARRPSPVVGARRAKGKPYTAAAQHVRARLFRWTRRVAGETLCEQCGSDTRVRDIQRKRTCKPACQPKHEDVTG